MRVFWIILLAWLCIRPDMRGADDKLIFDDVAHQKITSTAGCLTNIFGCLDQVRNHPDQTASLRVPAYITLVDRERSLIVLQDDSGAMAVHMDLNGLTLKAGQRVIVEGSGIFPSVRAFPNFPDQPDEREFLNSFETLPDRRTYYLSRIRGYLHPPVSGQYTFWTSADDGGEFCLSPDESPEKMKRIALNKIGYSTPPQIWNRYDSQRSQPVTLKAGEAYYVEAMHVQGYGSNYLGVAWEGPGMARSVIAGQYLTPWIKPFTEEMRMTGASLPTNGVLRERWTNFFVRDYGILKSSSWDEPIVRIRSVKLTAAGEGELPAPQRIEPDMSLDAIPNLHWVELEGEVNFVAGSGRNLQLELKREDSFLGVRILNWQGQPVERWIHSPVRIRGVLEHAAALPGELTNSVLWVPDRQQVSFLTSDDGRQEDLNRVAICEIEPTNPQMIWGRRVSVRGQIINRTTNGLLMVKGADNFQAFGSADGTNWASLGKPVEIGMSNAVVAGLALASRTPADLATASFEHLHGLGTNWRGADIGSRDQLGSFSVRDGILTLRGSGRQIGTRTDQLFFLHETLADQAEIFARLIDLKQTNLEQIDSRAQTGLMIRESLDSKAPYAAVIFTPSSGAVFQYRRNYGDDSDGFPAKLEARQFRWMKLIKRPSVLAVQGESGPEISTNQEVAITGTITWRNGTPTLTEASFEAMAKDIPSPQSARRPEPAISLAYFVGKSLHPVEPYLYRGMEAAKLRGIVTFCGEFLGRTILFAQEGNESGIRVSWPDPNTKPAFEAGQLVEMSGSSRVRLFPVILECSSIKSVGWGTLPEPVPYSPALVKSGSGQARWVEANGVVRFQGTNGILSLMTKDGALAVWVGPGKINGKAYVDALVRLRGVLSMDSAHVAHLLVPSPEFVEVQERAPTDPFMIPSFSVAELVGLDAEPERLRRRKLTGVVTCTLPRGIYVQDETGGAYVQTSEPILVHLGDRVEAVGFPENESAVVLSSAVIRKIETGVLPNPMRVNNRNFNRKKVAGKLIRLEAILLEQRETREAQWLTLQMGTKIFEAARIADQAGRLPTIPIGSRVAITGVCQIDQGGPRFEISEPETVRSLAALKIWLSAPTDVVLLERPPWWTLKRAAGVGGLFALGLFTALIRVRILRRRVAQKTRELQATMGQLEKETRTAAVLAERDRLAGEIHDSLEQGLTAIMLQLDAANKHSEKSPEARNILRMARNMAEFSRAEVQHAVWDMQSPLLANADLGAALTHVASLITSASSQVKVEIIGSPRSLPSSVEHHLLRIGQEAITNAVKHAQAKSIEVMLNYTATELILSVKDDGGGFSQETVREITKNGHFGLHGMRARANKIEAQLDIASEIGKGTTITVRMKLFLENHAASPSKIESP